jgi:hypothetical protein
MIKLKPNQAAYYVNNEEQIIYYRIETIFPEYIPTFAELKSEIYKFVDDSEYSDTDEDLMDFFNLNIDKFMTKDSLKIGGAFIKIQPDSIVVSTEEVESYYNSHREDFFKEPSVKVSYIYLPDMDGLSPELGRDVKSRLDMGIDFELERLGIGKTGLIPENEWVYLYKLSENIVSELNKTIEGSYTNPIYYETGWYIFKKIAQRGAFYPEMDEVKDQIEAQIKWDKANKVAFETAKAIYDSTTYYAQCKVYADSTELFQTEILPVNQEFPPIGKLGKHKRDLMLLWKYEKLNRILSNDKGYAVVFMLKNTKSQKMTFEQAEPLVKRAYHQENIEKHNKKYLNYLRGQLRHGANPDSLFFFFNKWKVVKNQKLGSEVEEVEYWDYILEDAVNRSIGYVSQPIKISENKYLIYQIENMKKVSAAKFRKLKSKFRIQLKEMRYKRWQQKFGAEVGVKRFNQ